MNVAIVGLGLIGGSMAKSIKNRTSHTVWGIDLNAETMTMARMCGAIDAPLTEENLPQADLILVAIRRRHRVGPAARAADRQVRHSGRPVRREADRGGGHRPHRRGTRLLLHRRPPHGR